MAIKPERSGSGPRGIEDHEGIVAYLNSLKSATSSFRQHLERNVAGNVLRYLGFQWIRYDQGLSTWRPLALKSSVPVPVTNRLAVATNGLVAAILGSTPPLGFHPASDQSDDVAAAGVADRILEVIKREVDHSFLEQIEAKWMVLAGNAFRVTHYEADLMGPMSFIQHERCNACLNVSDPKTLLDAGGQCPHCQQQGPYTPAEDMSGQPIGETVPRGRFVCEIHSPMTLWADPCAKSLDESEFVVISERKPLDWVSRTYGLDVAASVEVATGDADTSDWLIRSIAGATASRISASMDGSAQEWVTVRRLWLRPVPDRYPGGLYAEVIGEKVVASRPWPYHDGEGRPFLNIVHTQCDLVPGRLFGKSRIDDVVPQQEQRNQLESIINTHARRMGSVWVIPHGAGVSKISGEPGFVLRHNALAGVPAPHREGGDPIPATLLNRLDQIDGQIDALVGTYEVGRGEAPRGVSAYAALQLLDDRARTGQSSLLANWGHSRQKWAQQSLDAWREYADDERNLSLGEGAWAVERFSKADLLGGVQVSVDLGANRPYTQVGRRAAVDQAVRLGAISPYDPGEKFRILELLGVPEIMQDYQMERMDASRENDLFLQGMPVHPPYPWENHPIHMKQHKPLTTGERFEQLPPEVQQEVLAHVNGHYQAMQAASGQMGPGQIPPRPPGPAGGSDGTAKGDQGGSEAEMNQQDAQAMSPPTFAGAPGG